jgi:hypothetical protein
LAEVFNHAQGHSKDRPQIGVSLRSEVIFEGSEAPGNQSSGGGNGRTSPDDRSLKLCRQQNGAELASRLLDEWRDVI